jgi:transcriptional regulator with XRE-family HTH domain
MIGDDQALREQVDRATLNAIIAQLIFEARTRARLTQTELAKLVGTRQSVISRLEDADYEGHSLSMLSRIAGALGKRLVVQLVDERQTRAA